MALKYQEMIKTIPNCPPKSIKTTALVATAYRAVHKDIQDQRNFKPVALLTPNRSLHNGKASNCCDAYALSMYVSLDLLLLNLKRLQNACPNFLKRVGDHYAQLSLSDADGHCTSPNSSGHFGFFEHKDFDPLKTIKNHERLGL